MNLEVLEKFNFEEAMEYLREQTKFGINLGLDRIVALLAALGDPHKHGVRYIHVGGTNGKGSTGAMIAQMLTDAGYRTGFFSSPHLLTYCERMRINGENIKEERVANLISLASVAMKEVVAEGVETPTEFEISTAMALRYFTEEECDFAVIEVGMGGSIDSTNVIIPEVSVITNVSFDHMDYLGNTLSEIAEVKSGIIKAGIPLVSAEENPAIREIFVNKAFEINSPCYLINKDFSYEVIGDKEFVWKKDGLCYENLQLSLFGEHQFKNASCAVMVGVLLGLEEEVVRGSLRETLWQGRCQLLSALPPVLIDGAHNEAGLSALTKVLSDRFRDRKIALVIGMLDDKERGQALAALLQKATRVVVTKVRNPRCRDFASIATFAESCGVVAEALEDNREAVKRGLQLIKEGTCDMLLMSGSLYLIADLLAIWSEIQMDKPLILASASPRRSELLQEAGVSFEVFPSGAEEKMTGLLPSDLVIANALMKASDIAGKFPGRWVLGADTVVVLDGNILGKPKDEGDAFQMLSALSGRSHNVYTGLALATPFGIFSAYCCTEVIFTSLKPVEIDAYIATGEPLDKAGSYGIQGGGGVFVERICGEYDNVVGLPRKLLGELMAVAYMKKI